jgi:hypothetical protein
MHRFTRIYLLALLSGPALAGCGSVHWAAAPQKFTFAQAQQVQPLPPVGLIGLIEKGNQPRHSPELSAAAAEQLQAALSQQQQPLKLTGSLPVAAAEQARLRREVLTTVQLLMRSKPQAGGTAYSVQPLPVLDSLSYGSEARYVLATVRHGFTRTPGNYQGQVAKTLGIGLLTLGMAVPVSLKASAHLYAFVYDREEQRVVFFNHVGQEREPLKEAALQQQLRTVFAPAAKLN